MNENRAEDEADGHARKAEEQHGMGDTLESVERRKPLEGTPMGIFGPYEFGLEAALLNEIENGREETEAEGRIGREQGGDMRDEPTVANAFGRESVRLEPESGNEYEKEGYGQCKSAAREGAIEPPGEEEKGSNKEAEDRLDFARSDGNETMGLGEHFDRRDEVKKESYTAEMLAPFAPALDGIKDGGEDGDTGTRIQKSRDSEPEKMHAVGNLKALDTSIL